VLSYLQLERLIDVLVLGPLALLRSVLVGVVRFTLLFSPKEFVIVSFLCPVPDCHCLFIPRIFFIVYYSGEVGACLGWGESMGVQLILKLIRVACMVYMGELLIDLRLFPL